ncbi:hypothetical protein HELRODRAFT_193298, partial [Helobdella robusta]|uniref:Uncharacterized protein n=1 Tax=Helobdella robusta TaxID=6412 RepID=T1FUU8_HELRO
MCAVRHHRAKNNNLEGGMPKSRDFSVPLAIGIAFSCILIVFAVFVVSYVFVSILIDSEVLSAKSSLATTETAAVAEATTTTLTATTTTTTATASTATTAATAATTASTTTAYDPETTPIFAFNPQQIPSRKVNSPKMKEYQKGKKPVGNSLKSGNDEIRANDDPNGSRRNHNDRFDFRKDDSRHATYKDVGRQKNIVHDLVRNKIITPPASHYDEKLKKDDLQEEKPKNVGAPIQEKNIRHEGNSMARQNIVHQLNGSKTINVPDTHYKNGPKPWAKQRGKREIKERQTT